MQARAVERMAAPPKSSFTCRVPLVSGSSFQAAATTAMQNGSFSRNTARQPQPIGFQAISAPPANCPTAADRPTMVPYRLMTRASSRSPGYSARNVARVCGCSIAAATPSSTRPASSCTGVCAIPQIRLASPMPVEPRMNNRRRPYRSPNRPPVIRNTAYAAA